MASNEELMSGGPLTGAIQLPDGCWVRGRGLRRPPPPDAPEYGLYLGSRRMRRAHEPELTWPHDWLDWPDFRLPRDRAEATERIHALHGAARGGRLVEVACGAGIGRTGTVISCLAILAGVPSQEAVAWTRAHYHPRAGETRWQRRWASDFR